MTRLGSTKGVQYIPLAILESFLPNTIFKTPNVALWSQRKKKLPIESTDPPHIGSSPLKSLHPKKNRGKKNSDPRRASGLQLASETGLTRAVQESAESQDGPADVGVWQRAGQPLQDPRPVHSYSRGPSIPHSWPH